MIYLLGDNHFYHSNIIHLARRPFLTLEEMHTYMIQKWNNVVNKDDTVLHLGDFGFGKKEPLREICSQLNGHKILIKGNHDNRQTNVCLQYIGFEELHTQLQIGSLILSHRPIITGLGENINIHAHTHGTNPNQIEGYDLSNHFCVSCEVLDYTPIALDTILAFFNN